METWKLKAYKKICLTITKQKTAWWWGWAGGVSRDPQSIFV